MITWPTILKKQPLWMKRKTTSMKFSNLKIAGMVLSILAFFVTNARAQDETSSALNKSFQRILTESQRVWQPSSVEPIITVAAVGDLMMSSWIMGMVSAVIGFAWGFYLTAAINLLFLGGFGMLVRGFQPPQDASLP